MATNCPRDCFLLPESLKFPVCTRDCRYDCDGLRAAKIRAAQWGYQGVYEKATEMQQRRGCRRGKKTRVTG